MGRQSLCKGFEEWHDCGSFAGLPLGTEVLLALCFLQYALLGETDVKLLVCVAGLQKVERVMSVAFERSVSVLVVVGERGAR